MSDFMEKVAQWDESSGTAKTAVAASGIILGTAMSGAGAAGGGAFGRLPSALAGLALIDPLKPVSGSYGYLLNKKVFDGFGGLLNRVQADEAAAKKVVEEMSKAVAVEAISGVKGVFRKAQESARSPVRKAIFKRLAVEDDIIGQANPESMMRAYSTMSKVAPTLSTDINAVKSFLRSSAMHDGGIDPMTIKGLAEAETAVTGRWKAKR